MAENTNTHNVLFDRENEEAKRQSVKREWDALRNLLHLPQIEDLENDPLAVKARIVDFVMQVRGAVWDRAKLEKEVNESFNQEAKNTGIPKTPDKVIFIAESWLNVIHNQLDEEDIRGLLKELPSSIKPSNGDKVLRSPGVTIRGIKTNVSINLDHPIWLNANEEQIRFHLLGRRPDEVGLTFSPSLPPPPHDTIKDEDLDQIFNGVTLVIDPQNPNSSRRMSVSQAVKLGEPVMKLMSTSADSRELMLALSAIHSNPAAALALPQDKTGKLHTDIQKNELNLRTARALQSVGELRPSENLSYQKAAGGRALMDWIISKAYSGKSSTEDGKKFDLAPKRLPLGNNLRMLRPEIEELAKEAGFNELSIKRVYLVQGTKNKDNDEAFKEAIDKANRARERYVEAEKNFNTIGDQLNQMIALLEEHGVKVADVKSYKNIKDLLMDDAGTLFETRLDHVNSKTNFSNLAADIRRVLKGLKKNPVDLREAAYYETRRKELDDQMTEAQESKGQLNGSEACWAVIKKGLELQGLRGKELDQTLAVMRNRVQATPESTRDRKTLADNAFPWDGDDANDKHHIDHWNHGRQFIERKRLFKEKGTRIGTVAAAGVASGATLGAVGASLLGASAFTGGLAGIPIGAVAAGYGAYRFYRDKFTYNATGEYMKKLLDGGHPAFGIGINENPMQAKFRLPQLTHAYFALKYLISLPEGQELRLPETKEVVNFMRRLHEAILHRTQLSQNDALGLSQADAHKLRAEGMNVDPEKLSQMTPTDRMQMVQNYLVNSDVDYLENNGGKMRQLIEKQAKHAYHPIHDELEKHAKRVHTLKKYAYQNKWLSGAGVVRGTLKVGKTVYWDMPKTVIGAVASRTNKVAEGTWKRRKGIVLGAIVGSIFPVVGTAIGAGIGAMLDKGDASAPSAGHGGGHGH